MFWLLKNDKVMKLFKYAIFGILTTIINVYTFKVCIDFGVLYQIALVIAFILAIVFAYFTNRNLVFGSKAESLQEQLYEFFKFLISRISTLGVEFIGMFVLYDLLRYNIIYSKLFLNVVVIVLNYLLSQFFIFKQKMDEQSVVEEID